MSKKKIRVPGKRGAAWAGTSLPLAPIEDPRAFQVSLARTAYNYTRSYPGLEGVPLCASLPPDEQLTPAYNLLVLKSASEIALNFLPTLTRVLEEELAQDTTLTSILASRKWVEDLQDLWSGLLAVSAEELAEGPTAFLKSTLFDVLRPPEDSKDKNFLRADSEEDYAQLIDTLPKPLMLQIPRQSWMPERAPNAPLDLPCEQDWFFGYLQVAGFNTSNLRGVVSKAATKAGTRAVGDSKAIELDELLAKIPLTDEILSKVSGIAGLTLEQAVQQRCLYACDYTGLVDIEHPRAADSFMHGERRYMPCPVAVFYWNKSRPAGYPQDAAGVLQPIAIKLEPHEGAAIFTPNDCAGANDKHGYKWKIAKYFVNIACAIQHESVAHLGDCHFIMDAVAVATHRQLPEDHAIHKLLAPHLRFTLALNHGALNNLVVPGGVVATNVGPDIHWTLKLVNDGRKAWRWNENHPRDVFAMRGVDDSRPLVFPFRDDTLLLWDAIRTFVGRYVNQTYWTDENMLADAELARWFDELTAEDCADLKGLTRPTTRDALAEIVAQMIYTAGPLHASVNYAQYPLGAYIPSVSATIYGPPPTRDMTVNEKNVVDWFAPLDIALYTISFQYLLSSIQFDRFGHYSDNPQFPYFEERELQVMLEDFQSALAQAETTINARNRERVMPYPFQLPSRIPNSISI